MPPRVASLIPSGTEITSALGLGHALVGRSHCCDHPSEVAGLPVLTRPRVDPELPGAEIDAALRRILAGGESAYEILMERLVGLRPDVVLTQDCCDVCAVPMREVEDAVRRVAALSGARVCALHAHDVETLRADFHATAAALGVPERGGVLCARFDGVLDAVRARVEGMAPPRVVLLEWLEPPMVAGGWIPELAEAAGARPLIVDEPLRFRTVTWSDVSDAHPDLVVLLPCGWGVERTRQELARRELAGALSDATSEVPRGVWIVDGDAYMNRPGPRLAESTELLARVFHPERFGSGAPERGGPAAGPSVTATRWPGPDAEDQRTISAPSSRR